MLFLSSDLPFLLGSTFSCFFQVAERSFPNPFAVPLMVQLDLSSEGAQSFLKSKKPTLKGVESQGRYLLLKVNPDGNCFVGAAVTGALLWAVSETASRAIRGVLDRFKAAIRLSGSIAYAALSREQQVSALLSCRCCCCRCSYTFALLPFCRGSCLPHGQEVRAIAFGNVDAVQFHSNESHLIYVGCTEKMCLITASPYDFRWFS